MAPVPLDLLKTFVEVAAQGSMNAAAASLNLTPGAISQRVRNLEERLDVRLFRRSHRRIDLTSEGSELLDSLAPAFRQIEDAVAGVAGRRGERPLAINTVSSFAASWLTPRLGKFYDKHPDISLEIQVDCGLVDFAREPVDFAIRHGLGDYPGVEARWLFAPEMIVVASPGLLADGPSIGAPVDCLAHRRLQDGDRADWALWFRAHGVDAPDAERGPSFTEEHLLIRAAAAGQGLALVRDIYAQDELSKGTIVKALEVTWPTRFAYYLVGRPETFATSPGEAFWTWIASEAASAPALRCPRRAGAP